MHDTAHNMMISDIATSAWLIDFCYKALRSIALRCLSRNSYGRYQDLTEKFKKSVKVMVNESFQDNLYLTCSRNSVAFVIYMDLSLGFVCH